MLVVIKDLLEEDGLVINDKNTVFIGDAKQDMQAAHAFNIPFIHAKYIHSMKDEK